MNPLLILLTPIVQSLVGSLVGRAETQFPAPGSGQIKHAWVTEFVADFFADLEAKVNIPGWLKPIEAELEVLAKEEIEKVVALLDPK